MSIQSSAVEVGASPVQIISVTDFAAGAKDGRVTYEILNNGTRVLWIGGTNGVTSSNGSPLPAGGARTLDLRLGAVVWAVSDQAGQDVRILEVR